MKRTMMVSMDAVKALLGANGYELEVLAAEAAKQADKTKGEADKLFSEAKTATDKAEKDYADELARIKKTRDDVIAASGVKKAEATTLAGQADKIKSAIAAFGITATANK